MALKHKIAKLEDVAEPLRGLYRAEGDGFVLDVEGVVPKDKLDEFRNNNIALQRQIDAFKDVDPTKYRELMALQQSIAEGELIKKGDVDGVVALRVTAMKNELEGKLSDATSKLSTAESQLQVLLIDNAIRAAAIKNGALPTAVDDLILRARGIYTVKDGVPTPIKEGKVVYGKDGTTPMPIDEWAIGLKKDAPHLFQGSMGSGAGGGGRQAVGDTSKMTAVQKISAGIAAGGLVANLPGE